MRIGPKYKIARRLGAPIFEKTQTQKYALSQARKDKVGFAFSRPKSEFGLQLLEKQKARFTYALSEKQFSKYAKKALAKKVAHATSHLFEDLELRLDNVVYKAGFAPTRLAARQIVSHGHIKVNNKRVNIPSCRLSVGDEVSIREQSAGKPLFVKLNEQLVETKRPLWLKFDMKSKLATLTDVPKFEQAENMFDLNAVLEFYSR